MEPDFSGYATKAGLKCTDGRTIMPDAFKHQDRVQVPLVWQHGHKDPENVLGHVKLENRKDGVYAYAFMNNTKKAEHALSLVEHGDINQFSIWANDLIERSGRVIHGAIREVSLVLAGANPGALIDNVTIRHSDGDVDVLDDEAIIYTGLYLEHADGDDEEDDEDMADDEKDDEDLTVQDVYDSMTEEQKQVLHYMVGEALASASEETDEDEDDDDAAEHSNKKGKDLMHNIFENNDDNKQIVLSHSEIKEIVSDATRMGSLKDAVESYALSHGIENIDYLFPEARTLAGTPEFFTRRLEWVNNVLNGATKSPFSRVKTMSANLTEAEARAKGYIKGNLKAEEFFSVSRRVTTPTTIYKKQKLDRDDIVDITDFDVVAWLKGELRIMLDEELARAVLIGDGRQFNDDDKINESNIRPIATDHELFTTTINVNLDDNNSSIQEVVDAVIANRSSYRGTGTPSFYTTETVISQFFTLKDAIGRRIYQTLDDIANELRVNEIIPVEALEEHPDIVGIMVNMRDYNIGADSGGNVGMFDDFDIDYNQYKYLIETRCSGALTKLKSALVVKRVDGTRVLAIPATPSFDGTEITITDTTGVAYTNVGTEGAMTNSGGPYQVPAGGGSITVTAKPTAGYYFSTESTITWTFTNHNPAE